MKKLNLSLAGLVLSLGLIASSAFANNANNNPGHNGNPPSNNGSSTSSSGSYSGSGSVTGGGYINYGTSTQTTSWASNTNGTSESDVGGGGLAESGVRGTGTSTQYNSNGASSWASASGKGNGNGVVTSTNGGSNEYSSSTGNVSDGGYGDVQGQAGADWSSQSNGTFTKQVTGNSTTGSAYLYGGAGYGANSEYAQTTQSK